MRWPLAVALAVLLAGCVSGPTPQDARISEQGDLDTEPAGCTAGEDGPRAAFEWSWQAGEPSEGSTSFSLPAGTVAASVTGSSASAIQSSWEFVVANADLREAWRYGSGTATVVGNDNNVPREDRFVAGPGAYTLSWTLTGAPTELGLAFSSIACKA